MTTIVEYDDSLDNLKGTLHQMWEDDATLDALHPVARFYTGRVPSSKPGSAVPAPPDMPYTRLELPSAKRGTRTTDTEYPMQEVKFHLWTDTADEADPVAQAIMDCYVNQAFEFTVGESTSKVIDTRDSGITQRQITKPTYTAWETVVCLTMRIMRNR